MPRRPSGGVANTRSSPISRVTSKTLHLRFEPTDATPDGMGAFEDSGHYLIHWERADSRWRMAQYIANRSRDP